MPGTRCATTGNGLAGSALDDNQRDSPSDLIQAGYPAYSGFGLGRVPVRVAKHVWRRAARRRPGISARRKPLGSISTSNGSAERSRAAFTVAVIHEWYRGLRRSAPAQSRPAETGRQHWTQDGSPPGRSRPAHRRSRRRSLEGEWSRR